MSQKNDVKKVTIEDTDVIINYYISQIMCFSERLMDLSGEVKKLAKWGSTPQPRVLKGRAL